jgi:hypothetical protein
MPAHIHPAPQCSGRVGAVCVTIGCSHKSCLNGGAMLECVRLTDGTYRCFHAFTREQFYCIKAKPFSCEVR